MVLWRSQNSFSFVVGYAGVGNGVSAVVSGVTEGNMFTGFVAAGFVS